MNKQIGFGTGEGIWLLDMFIEAVHVTPEKADQILEKYNLKNRDKSDYQKNYLADQMVRGQWIERTGETIKVDEVRILGDGQHRLEGVIISGVPQIFLFVHNIDLRAFKVLDTQKSRTAADSFKSEGYQYHTQLAALTKRYLVLLRNSQDHNVSSRRKGISNQDQLFEYESNKEHYDEILQRGLRLYKHCSALTTTDYCGYSLYLIRHKEHNPEKVYSFFNQFAEVEQSDYRYRPTCRSSSRRGNNTCLHP